MRVTSIVGARPQFVKLAPVAAELKARGHEHRIIHSGQHYDADMSESFFDELVIPPADVHLSIGSGPHGRQTGRMLEAIEQVLSGDSSDWVLVYGDTNTTIAAALAAVKLHRPLAHLEAGLRSRNRRMPEEHNRVLTDHAADLLLAPTPTALANLESEGLAGRSVMVGDVMIDVLLDVAERVRGSPWPAEWPAGDFVLATIHRAENTDSPDRLRGIVASLQSLDLPVLLSVHPRLRAIAQQDSLDLAAGALHPVAPLPYPRLVQALLRSCAVVTDSGGLQKEAYALGTACTTVRHETEWTETLEDGWNVLAGDPTQIARAVARARPASPPALSAYGGGAASRAVVDALAGTPS